MLTIHSFIFSFFTPYLLDAPYANLHSKVGFIFGSLACCSLLFAFFCVPEMKGRSLEEINQMFQDGVPVRRFGAHPFATAATEEDAAERKIKSTSDGSIKAGAVEVEREDDGIES